MLKRSWELRKRKVLRKMCWQCLISERPVVVTQEVIGAERRCVGSA